MLGVWSAEPRRGRSEVAVGTSILLISFLIDFLLAVPGGRIGVDDFFEDFSLARETFGVSGGGMSIDAGTLSLTTDGVDSDRVGVDCLAALED